MIFNQTDLFEKKLNYIFKDKNLLNTALTHPSSTSDENYERLEFLGDAVIELIISDYLFNNYKNFSEGMLTQKRSEIVCSKSLAAIARSINLGSVLRLGKGEELSSGREKTSILENALEALMGAIYIDGGFYAAKESIERLFYSTINHIMKNKVARDYKSQLQELLQKTLKKDVCYSVINKEGPPHNLVFYVQLIVGDNSIYQGIGHTKKEAEQNAAKLALEDFDNLIKNFDKHNN